MKTFSACFQTWDGVVRSWSLPPTVYPPREDTQLLARVLKHELMGARPHNILEIGTGSGAVALALALEGHFVTAIDIHPEAAAVTQGLAKTHSLQDRLVAREQDVQDFKFDTSFDIIVWNAPYLDPPDSEGQKLSWSDEVSLTALVEDHRQLSSNILASQGLTPDGFLVVILSDGKTSADIARTYADDGWALRPLGRTSHGGERLVALCLWRPWPCRRTIELDEVESTNVVALETKKLDAGDQVVARKQTSGKGRKGRVWVSRAGDLTASWVLPSAYESVNTPYLLQLRTALATMDGVLRWLDSHPIAFDQTNAWHPALGIKWPNDLMINGEKFGGILVEGRQQGPGSRTVVGIGLNLSQAPKPWGSLCSLHSQKAPGALITHITAAIAHWFDEGPAGEPPGDAEVLSTAHRAMSRWGSLQCTPLSLNLDGTICAEGPRLAG
ncbi:MAG TPA: biotin--[acetyl-CoA-carboxylase] ligase [Candidatus Poseidoniales archaeon]|nr:biotin--[acetyl-CoA-carboxylase] ligase [Candidatus Poseidoniales archaeon]